MKKYVFNIVAYIYVDLAVLKVYVRKKFHVIKTKNYLITMFLLALYNFLTIKVYLDCIFSYLND